MKLEILLKELKATKAYYEFIRENPGAFFAAAFIVLNDSGEDKFQLDFFIPEKKKIASAEYPFHSIKIHEDFIENSSRLKVVMIDISSLRQIVEDAKTEKRVSMRTNKIIALLKDDLWQLTCLSSGLDMLKINIDSLTGEIKRFEKVNFMNFMSVKK